MNPPKVFISYSWSTPEHREWVLNLATRLTTDGIDVVLDVWDLKQGHDKFAFMESMVTDPSVNKVLVICDKRYSANADKRHGGVGTETQLISAEVYGKTKQEKFIAVVTEFEHGEACVPTFLKTRIFINFSTNEKQAENYEELVRAIFDKPLHKKPPMGSPPTFLLEERAHLIKTIVRFEELKKCWIGQKPAARGLERRYLELFISSLEEFRVSDRTDAFDEAHVQSIASMKPYRDQFIDFLELKCTYTPSDNFDQVFDFFENITGYFNPPDGVSSWSESNFDNYRFFAWELFIYLISLLWKRDLQGVASRFLADRYHIERNLREAAHDESYEFFDAVCEGLDQHRNLRLNLKRTTVTGMIMKERADNEYIKFDELMTTDFLLCLRHVLHKGEGWARPWFPRTLAYSSNFTRTPFNLFTRAATSAKRRDALCVLLGVDSIRTLLKMFDAAEATGELQHYRFNAAFGGIQFRTLMNYEGLASAIGYVK